MLRYQMIGSNLRRARVRLELTQGDVAKQIETTFGYYGRIERGDLKPNLERLVQICRVLELPIEAALYGAIPTDYTMTNAPPNDEQFIIKISKLCECASEKTKEMILRVCREIVSEEKSKV